MLVWEACRGWPDTTPVRRIPSTCLLQEKQAGNAECGEGAMYFTGVLLYISLPEGEKC